MLLRSRNGAGSSLALALLAVASGQQCGGPTPDPDDDGSTGDPCLVTGVICTVAGMGMSVFDGDGRDALDTSFYYPLDIEFDALGRPLILDWNNWRVRRLNDNGTIETVIGVDYEDVPMPGAFANQTPLHHASDIEMDNQGRLYLAGNHAPVVFYVGTDNRVQLAAGGDTVGYSGDGGPALEAELTAPFGVTPTPDGGFYFSDLEAHVVRYVDPAGIIRTVVGTGNRGYSGDGGPGTDALLNGPTRLRLDGDGNLYICDTDNHAIRRLAPDGTITTFAGTGVLGYTGDGGPASSAQLHTPYDARFSPSGDLYVADTGNNVIRRIAPDGTITTVIGTGQAGFAGDEDDARDCQLDRPSSVIFDGDGSMWISDTFNQRVRRVHRFLDQ